MNTFRNKKKFQFILLFAIFCSACSSTTMIRSTDPNAKIFVDGEYKGTGTVPYSDQKIIGASTYVKIERPGCQTDTYIFSRNEEFDAGACIGGVFFLIPFLWIQKYKPEHVYDYKCRTIQSIAPAVLESAH